jgi:hypothetical protein
MPKLLRVPMILRTGPYYLQREYPMTRVDYICFYLRDGSIEEFDLTDPTIPLPRFLSLTTLPQNFLAIKSSTG